MHFFDVPPEMLSIPEVIQTVCYMRRPDQWSMHSLCVCGAEHGGALLQKHAAEIVANGQASSGAAVAKLTVAETIHKEYQQNPNTRIRLPEDAAHLFSDLCQVPYRLYLSRVTGW
jgi:hypothetical protein